MEDLDFHPGPKRGICQNDDPKPGVWPWALKETLSSHPVPIVWLLGSRIWSYTISGSFLFRYHEPADVRNGWCPKMIFIVTEVAQWIQLRMRRIQWSAAQVVAEIGSQTFPHPKMMKQKTPETLMMWCDIHVGFTMFIHVLPFLHPHCGGNIHILVANSACLASHAIEAQDDEDQGVSSQNSEARTSEMEKWKDQFTSMGVS